ncbi:hypothetical protein [Streptomyces canus]|uniref:hypothetical protein n=1 Tax=Streptomyces canus TaxID=58343 RepID=UPI002E3628F7|nr:hypothetical protein [Streptomyces canus]
MTDDVLFLSGPQVTAPGSGTQVLAHVRDLKSVRLRSPTPRNRDRAAEAVGSAEEAVSGASVDTDVLRRSAAVVVDDPATVAEHAEPVVNALRTGLPADLVGLGAQDAAAAKGESP